MASSSNQVDIKPADAPTATAAQPLAPKAQVVGRKISANEQSKAPADAVKYRIIEIPMPDGTIQKVKQPIVPTDKKTASSGTAKFKIIEIPMPDGTIQKVKQPIVPKDKTVSPGATKAADAANFKIITVRMPDGSLKKVKRPIVPGDKTVSRGMTKDPSASITKPQAKPNASQSSKVAASDLQNTKNVSGVPSPSTSKAGGQPKASPPGSTSKNPVAAESEQAASEKAKGVETSKAMAEEKAAPPPAEQGTDIRDSLHAQDSYYKQKRRHQFKTTLLRGLVGSVASSAFDFPGFESGDDALDSDFSGDDDDDFDDDDDNTVISHDGEDHDSHHDSAHSHGDDDTHGLSAHVTLNPGAALGGIAAAASAPPRPPPPAAGAGQKAAVGDDIKEKETYKITGRDMTALEEKIEQDNQNKALQRHFADISFYIMASLSVVLPLLFLILAIVIACANGKTVSSDWGKLREAIKIAISAWPIVFAAVVAQTFKTWATYRVERGIKLMELEQLVGSNSFASAVKQPFVLRRLNVLTLGLLIIWCLSPIGTQAMQYIYTLQRGVVTEDIGVQYLMAYGENRLFSPSSAEMDSETQDILLQTVAVSYMSSLMPAGTAQLGTVSGSHVGLSTQDPYSHPTFPGAGFYGIPLGLPQPKLFGYGTIYTSDTVLDASQPAYEQIRFNMTTSYFKFPSCSPWQSKKGSDLGNLSFSLSNTLGLGLNFSSVSDASYPNNMLYFATRTNVTQSQNAFDGSNFEFDNNTAAFADWDFEYTECTFFQTFAEAPFVCSTQLDSGGYAYRCGMDTLVALYTRELGADEVDKSWYTNFTDFSDAWAASGNPYSDYAPTTPTERYAEKKIYQDGSLYSPNATDFDEETGSISPIVFGYNIGDLFNTWVGLGFCPECLRIDAYFHPLTSMTQEIQDTFINVTAKHTYTNDIVYVIDFRWWAVLLTCSIVLLLLGIGSVLVESMLVAPDVLGYVSTVARNSRYINLPKSSLNGAMSGSERARNLGQTKVMMQDVKANADVGKIALGMKHEKAKRLQPGRLYR